MKNWSWALLFIALGVIAWLLLWGPHQPPPVQPPAVPPVANRTTPETTPAKTANAIPGSNAPAMLADAPPKAPAAVPVPASRPPVSTPPPVEPTFESTNLPPVTILENMRTVIRQYGSTFGGNPVGTNPEITKALQGDNPKQINFLRADGNRVNALGELVDPWGTPYFFHQLSATEMEIRSAGPDKIMYTADDLVTK